MSLDAPAPPGEADLVRYSRPQSGANGHHCASHVVGHRRGLLKVAGEKIPRSLAGCERYERDSIIRGH